MQSTLLKNQLLISIFKLPLVAAFPLTPEATMFQRKRKGWQSKKQLNRKTKLKRMRNFVLVRAEVYIIAMRQLPSVNEGRGCF